MTAGQVALVFGDGSHPDGVLVAALPVQQERQVQEGEGDPGGVVGLAEQLEIALDEDHVLLFADIFFRLKKPVQMLALDISRSFGRIQIFRLAFFDDSRAERDRISVGVEHRKNDSPAKTVVNAVLFLVFRNQPRRLDRFFVDDDVQLNRILISLGAEDVRIKNLADKKEITTAQLKDILESLVAPIRRRRSELARDPGAVEVLLCTGTARTREIAADVLREIRAVFRLDRVPLK